MLPCQWTGTRDLPKEELTEFILIRLFGRFGFGICLVLVTSFWNLSQERKFSYFSKQWAPFIKSGFSSWLSLNKAVNTLYRRKYDPLLWYCLTSITYCSTNSNSILGSMTPSLYSFRWSKCSQWGPSGQFHYVCHIFSCLYHPSSKPLIKFSFSVAIKFLSRKEVSWYWIIL